MEDSKEIDALSMDGNPIVIGSLVRYINTGSVGKVTDIMEEEDGIWVMMDSTGLYYKPQTLIIADPSELKEERIARVSAAEAEGYVRSSAAGPDSGVDIGQVTGGG
ncbi:MAG: DUF2098 domain-containing protein [Methanolobus sp.]|nr:DUF2098 domain-containing protein [Methanolobus sp.]